MRVRRMMRVCIEMIRELYRAEMAVVWWEIGGGGGRDWTVVCVPTQSCRRDARSKHTLTALCVCLYIMIWTTEYTRTRICTFAARVVRL